MNFFILFIAFSLHNLFNSNVFSAEETKIVGGETAKKSYPYQISLQVKVPMYIAFFPTGKNEWMHNCGGKLIS